MKKIVILIFTFSLLLIFLSFLNYELEVIQTRINETDIINKKLENELIFLKSEWEYINSPKNLSELLNNYLNHQTIELIEFKDFVKLISEKDFKNE
jgi:hypothetical protein